MKLNKVLDVILNHIQSDNLYIEALDIDDVDELESYVYNYDLSFLDLLDEGISMEIESIDIEDVVSELSDKLKFHLAKHYIEEYDDVDDLNKSFVYYYIQHRFMLSLTDFVLLEAFKDMVLTSRDIEKKLLERQEIDILVILKKNHFKLPTKDNPKDNLEFNKGYLLSFIHNKLSYEEQFNVLNVVKGYNDAAWSVLLVSVYEEGLLRDSEWFIY